MSVLVCEKHPHVTMLIFVLDLGPLILLLLQLLGHQQVLLHQAAFIDVGCQVALDCTQTQKAQTHKHYNSV